MLRRRDFMKGIAGAAAALSSAQRTVAAADGPSRLVVVGLPSGHMVGPDGMRGLGGWRPSGLGGRTTMPLGERLPDPFRPLDAWANQLLLVENLALIPGSHSASVSLLTGTDLGPGARTGRGGIFHPRGASFDQVLGERWGVEPLTLAAHIGGFQVSEGWWTFRDARDPVTPILSAQRAYEWLRTAAPTDDPRDTGLRRRTVLGALRTDLDRVQDHFHGAEATRAHEAGLEDLLRSLDAAPATERVASIEAPGADWSVSENSGRDMPALMRYYFRVVTEALRVGATRVATVLMDNFGGTLRPDWAHEVPGLQNSYRYHAINHTFAGVEGAGSEGLPVAAAVSMVEKFNQLTSTLIADLLAMLHEARDPDGTPVLDRTIVVVVRTMGRNHDRNRRLDLIAGGGALGVRGGRFIEAGSGRFVNDLWTGLAQHFGETDLTSFGDGPRNLSPLDLG